MPNFHISPKLFNPGELRDIGTKALRLKPGFQHNDMSYHIRILKILNIRTDCQRHIFPYFVSITPN